LAFTVASSALLFFNGIDENLIPVGKVFDASKTAGQYYEIIMKVESDGGLVNFARQGDFPIKTSAQARVGQPARIYVLFFILFACMRSVLQAQESAVPETATNSLAGQIATLQLQMTNAWQRVEAIVNQPVRAYVKAPGYHIGLSSPGWFHPGAIKPDFDTVDVRQSQQFPYNKYQYMTSDLNSGVMFLSRDLEFNSMTKYFYTNRSLPKHRLTEAEMLEINRLYRIIGHCQDELNRLQNPPGAETTSSANDQSDGEPAGAAGFIDNIRRVPQQTRILYGGIAIGALIILVVASRFVRKKSG
jgi:hypothetical protein